jgi:hypothetical protein
MPAKSGRNAAPALWRRDAPHHSGCASIQAGYGCTRNKPATATDYCGATTVVVVVAGGTGWVTVVRLTVVVVDGGGVVL